MVITGTPYATANNSEVIDLTIASANCSLFDLSGIPLQRATGAWIEDSLLICGGQNYKGEALKQCFTLGDDEKVFDMLYARAFPSSVKLPNNKVWVTGGFSHTQGKSIEAFLLEHYINSKPLTYVLFLFL